MPGGVGEDPQLARARCFYLRLAQLYAVEARVITTEQMEQITAELRRVSAPGVPPEQKLQVCDWAAREYGNAYFRTRSGALKRVFPKALKVKKLGRR